MVNLLRHNCEPAVPIAVEHVAVNEGDVLAVHVPVGQDKPYRAFAECSRLCDRVLRPQSPR
ncbi:MAG: AlbA family DNA-binding domain-containing protein [Dehalococcoidia bacterium]